MMEYGDGRDGGLICEVLFLYCIALAEFKLQQQHTISHKVTHQDG